MKFYIIIFLLLTQASNVHGNDLDLQENFNNLAWDSDQLRECWNFTVGNSQLREFYSPHYPDKYSNDTTCMRVLVAPKGHRIRLDFRDNFDIEDSDKCKFDFLELRDGPFGHSKLVGRYCGKRHPPMVESSSRFLWTRFESDDSIEYEGFRAVYDFIPTQEYGNSTANATVCRFDVSVKNHQGFISMEDIPDNVLNRANDTTGPIDCTWVIEAPANHRVYIKWMLYKTTQTSGCATGHLELYERNLDLQHQPRMYCGRKAGDAKSTSNHLYLRLHALSRQYVPSFRIRLTLFTDGPCGDNMFDCRDNTCISRSLMCNGHSNCNHSWDEMACENTSSAPSTTTEPLIVTHNIIILGVVGGAIVTIIFISIGITCRQRRKEQKWRQMALNQEKQSIALEMTVLLNKNSQPNHTHHRNERLNPAENHVVRRTANHVSADVASAQPLSRRHSRKGSYGNNPKSGAFDFEVSDVYDQSNNGVFKSYLDVDRYNDEDSSPNPSITKEIPAIVTIEIPPAQASRKVSTPPAALTKISSIDKSCGLKEKSREDKTPSPRPDLVLEEKFIYPNIHTRDNPRRLSVDTIRSDKSDVWKPRVGLPDYKSLDLPRYDCRPTDSSRVDFRATDFVKFDCNKLPNPPGAGVASKSSFTPEHSGRPKMKPSLQSQPKQAAQAACKKPEKHISFKTPSSRDSPDIFYTRPNRGTQKHHPV